MASSSIPNLTSAAGSGSGIDVVSTVNSLIDGMRGPERLMQTQQTLLNSQAAALSSIGASLSDLLTKVNALQDAGGAFGARAVTSSNTSALTATAQAGATTGSHVISISSLATQSSDYTSPVANADTPLSAGSFSVKVGSGAATTITIDSSNNTLSKLATSINSQALGVQASVVTDANGSRLVLLSGTSGVPGDLAVTSSSPDFSFTKAVTGTNASLTVDGVPISSASNTVNGVLPGVTLTLSGTTPTPVTLSIAADNTQVTTAINDFVTSYNSTVKAINLQFTADPTGQHAQPLSTDPSLRIVQQALQQNINHTVANNNGIGSLADLGLNLQNDGTISVDSSKLTSAIAGHLSDVQSFFQQAGNGFAANFATHLNNLTAPTTGALAVSLQGVRDTQTMLTKQISDFEDRLAVTQQSLMDEYSRVDTMLRQMPSLMAQISAQLGSLR